MDPVFLLFIVKLYRKREGSSYRGFELLGFDCNFMKLDFLEKALLKLQI